MLPQPNNYFLASYTDKSPDLCDLCWSFFFWFPFHNEREALRWLPWWPGEADTALTSAPLAYQQKQATVDSDAFASSSDPGAQVLRLTMMDANEITESGFQNISFSTSETYM